MPTMVVVACVALLAAFATLTALLLGAILLTRLEQVQEWRRRRHLTPGRKERERPHERAGRPRTRDDP